jgi:hypothetical protein
MADAHCLVAATVYTRRSTTPTSECTAGGGSSLSERTPSTNGPARSPPIRYSVSPRCLATAATRARCAPRVPTTICSYHLQCAASPSAMLLADLPALITIKRAPCRRRRTLADGGGRLRGAQHTRATRRSAPSAGGRGPSSLCRGHCAGRPGVRTIAPAAAATTRPREEGLGQHDDENRGGNVEEDGDTAELVRLPQHSAAAHLCISGAGWAPSRASR